MNNDFDVKKDLEKKEERELNKTIEENPNFEVVDEDQRMDIDGLDVLESEDRDQDPSENQNEEKENLEAFIAKEEKKEKKRERQNLYFENEFGKDFYPRELYAGFFRRLFAFVLDSLIGSAFAGIFVNLIFSLGGLESKALYGGLSTLFYLVYFTGSTYLTNGQTLGKMIFNLRVISLDGEKLTFPQVLTREFFGRYIHTYSFLFLLYLLVAFTERKQSLSDIFADTGVIDLSKEKAYMVGQMDRQSFIYE